MLALVIAGLSVPVNPSVVLAQAPDPRAEAHFTYDKGAPLDLKLLSIKTLGTVVVQDITYSGRDGETVPAYLVIPKSERKFAAVIWGHWLMPGARNSNREEFLDEAVALAPAGVISLLIDAPQARPEYKPTPNPALVAQQVADVRRGLDLLLSRPDVDADRIAYVGHSWDAGIGAILDALDKRFSAFVFMSGPQSMREYILSSDSTRILAMRKTADLAKLEQSLTANAWADPGSYAGNFGPAPALFQYGLHDEEWVPLADAKDYLAMTTGPKQAEFYDADHALNAKARLDRDSFLRAELSLRP
jgi:cephalosporin-C deacetylase-like acetyl esterase